MPSGRPRGRHGRPPLRILNEGCNRLPGSVAERLGFPRPAFLAEILLSGGDMSTQPTVSPHRRCLAVAWGAVWLVALAGCPGQLEFGFPALDASFRPRPEATPDGAPPVVPAPDASPTPPARPDASLPPPPARDAGPPPPAADSGVAASCTSTDQVVASILRPRCGMCHDASSATFVGFDLVAAGVRDRLRASSAICVGRRFVVTAPSVGGYFFDKLGLMTPPCGQRMPPVGAPLGASEIECLKTWVQANP
jgi:hypothetical protein